MERKYYSINEVTAKSAHEMMSFSDYVEGSKTAEYKKYVDEAYDLADKIAAQKPEDAERAYRMADSYSKKMADNLNQASRIGCMCPSVMIAGPSNFPTKKKERQNAASDKNYLEFAEIQKILQKMENILHERETIRSDDPGAIEKLEKKLETLKEQQELMKAANRAVRMKDVESGDARLKELGFDESQIKSLREPDFCGRLGFPDYQLQNNNANIHRIAGRIEELRKAKEQADFTESEMEYKDFKVVRNQEEMRLQLMFDGKPEANVREILKENGFRWAPSQGAWQRLLNANSEYALQRVVEQLKQIA